MWHVLLAQVWTHYKIGKLNMWTLFCNVCINFLNNQIWKDIKLELNNKPASVTTFSTDFSFQRHEPWLIDGPSKCKGSSTMWSMYLFLWSSLWRKHALFSLTYCILVWPVLLAQVLPHPQLIFPSKTCFFGIYLNFQCQKLL